jgi:hypothetical protein
MRKVADAIAVEETPVSRESKLLECVVGAVVGSTVGALGGLAVKKAIHVVGSKITGDPEWEKHAAHPLPTMQTPQVSPESVSHTYYKYCTKWHKSSEELQSCKTANGCLHGENANQRNAIMVPFEKDENFVYLCKLANCTCEGYHGKDALKKRLRQRKNQLKEAASTHPIFVTPRLQAMGIVTSSTDTTQCVRVYDHIVFPKHVVKDGADSVGVSYKVADIIKTHVFLRADWKDLAYDTYACRIPKGSQLGSVPNLTVCNRDCKVGDFVMRYSWNLVDTLEKSFDARSSMGKVLTATLRDKDKNPYMWYDANYSSVGGDCAGLIVNPSGQLVGLHNEGNNGFNSFIGFTTSMVDKLIAYNQTN